MATLQRQQAALLFGVKTEWYRRWLWSLALSILPHSLRLRDKQPGLKMNSNSLVFKTQVLNSQRLSNWFELRFLWSFWRRPELLSVMCWNIRLQEEAKYSEKVRRQSQPTALIYHRLWIREPWRLGRQCTRKSQAENKKHEVGHALHRLVNQTQFCNRFASLVVGDFVTPGCPHPLFVTDSFSIPVESLLLE